MKLSRHTTDQIIEKLCKAWERINSRHVYISRDIAEFLERIPADDCVVSVDTKPRR